MYYTGVDPYKNYLYHHGIKGQKCGIRRFQNPDGTLTDAGRKRYLKKYGWSYERADELPKSRKEAKAMKKQETDMDSATKQYNKALYERLSQMPARTKAEIKAKHNYLRQIQNEMLLMGAAGYNKAAELRANANDLYDKNSSKYRLALHGANVVQSYAHWLQKSFQGYIAEFEVNHDIPEKDWIHMF